MGRSWPDVSTASRPAVGLGTPVPPLPRRERAAATSSRETGRIALEDRPRTLRPSLRPAAQAPTAVPGPRPATDDADLIGAALASLTRSRRAERPQDDVPAADDGTEDDGIADDGIADDGIEGDDDLEADTDEATHSEAGARRPRRRLPAAPGRRPALLLIALVVGALIAALPGGAGSNQAVAGSGSDFGLSAGTDTGFAGGVDLTGARGEISEAEAEARLSEIAASRAARQPKFFLPTQGRLTTCFCTRWGSMHYGLDLAAPLGTPILAATDGVVLRAGAASGYGYAVYIQDSNGDVHVYGHMRYFFVEAGDVVSAGDLIAKVGNEGQSTGPHVHYQIHKGGMNGKPIDPEAWLGERGISV